MANLHVRVGHTWQLVSLTTRQAIAVAGATLWAPSRAELIALLSRIDRPKDHARANALAALPPPIGPPPQA